MDKTRLHLIASIVFAALAAVCFGLLAWALAEGAVVQSVTGSRLRTGTAGVDSAGQDRYPNRVYTREGDPGVYWRAVGALAVFGSLFVFVAFVERRSYRTLRDHPGNPAASPELLAKIDRAGRQYPERRETLLRARSALVRMDSPEVAAALEDFLEKLSKAPDREAALKEIEGLAKALEWVDRL